MRQYRLINSPYVYVQAQQENDDCEGDEDHEPAIGTLHRSRLAWIAWGFHGNLLVRDLFVHFVAYRRIVATLPIQQGGLTSSSVSGMIEPPNRDTCSAVAFHGGESTLSVIRF
jgi:hypothetical protein